jgi:hypothetical protein
VPEYYKNKSSKWWFIFLKHVKNEVEIW